MKKRKKHNYSLGDRAYLYPEETREFLLEVLKKNQGNTTLAAKAIRISRRIFEDYCHRLGITSGMIREVWKAYKKRFRLPPRVEEE